MIIFNESSIDESEEVHFECRDFTKESGIKELNRLFIVNKWNKEMLSYLFFTYLEPFFRMVPKVKKTKILDWITWSFSPLNAAIYKNNELSNLSR
jgi:hypothetical protein